MTRQVPVSCWMKSCVLRAMRAEKSVGRAMASSSALVCSDWVPPWVAASASMAVRVTLLNTSWAVRLQPLVWQCVRSAKDRASFGLNSFSISFAHSRRAARNLAISMKKFMPTPKKNESLGANASMSRPAPTPARTYSTPSASV